MEQRRPADGAGHAGRAQRRPPLLAPKQIAISRPPRRGQLTITRPSPNPRVQRRPPGPPHQTADLIGRDRGRRHRLDAAPGIKTTRC